ncbi:bifunctional adenosylcobinamide kinase/adenosylcobinamide-phosphate guanylyltransferase [Marivivens donghaensis]|uniref:Bifunctional adenosylcobalamin biosynthesis protein n=1 Tax=Marivivens donghaensis TaxID=1699413 RepID=A0ABX0VTE3_9RHOB|nr:bifunctional adenosylcobinamide kinase/adenosylcobinamide-phosphate guanylyltransferase [Marivivens donghaensis]NIY71195.1 bifunctional adenosylcobinamide kinase/adenosylcobinamide-phosphate guanylyltransferase [Marivivens donghaensis]
MVASNNVKKLTLVLGGAASGKSEFAEKLVIGTGKSRKYLATSQIFDAEMQAKVDRHLVQRGDGWETIEEPLDLGPTLEAAVPDQIILLDCATLWLTNVLMAEREIAQESAKLVAELRSCEAEVVVVSNEVGMGIVPEHAISRQFREAQGRLNAMIAEAADNVFFVAAGLPLVLKGELP